MKKKGLMLLLLIIVGCVALYADDDEKDEKATAIYLAPAALVGINSEVDVISVLPGANLVIENFGKRDSALVSVGYFHGSEKYIESLGLATSLLLPNNAKPKDSSAFVVPVTYSYPLTPVRAKNWRVQINSAFRGNLIIASAEYDSLSEPSYVMESDIFKFSLDFVLGLGMYHSFENNLNIRYGFDFGLPLFGYQLINTTNGPGSYSDEAELDFDNSGITLFLDGGFNIMPYIAVGISF